ncbi:MAG: hypothetical protein QOI47_1138 [Actinomycetota bacterium]|jgi:hypothetical protein|nr:hypothetical protein [Actinomycetota bacterium]
MSEVDGGMHGRPTAEELVVAVREFLERDVMPATTGPVSFHARVAVNALSAVERELRDGPAMAEAHRARLAALGFTSEGDLAEAIRAGAADADDRYDEIVTAVRATVRDKLSVANPKYLANPTPD